jgi:hypothetical protein
MNEVPVLRAGISFHWITLDEEKWPVKAQTRNMENFYVCCERLFFGWWLLNVLQPTDELPRPGGTVTLRVPRTSGVISSSTAVFKCVIFKTFFCWQYDFECQLCTVSSMTSWKCGKKRGESFCFLAICSMSLCGWWDAEYQHNILAGWVGRNAVLNTCSSGI